MDTRISPVHVRDAEFEACADGSLLVRNPEPLGSCPKRMTERLERWAALTPDRPFLAARSGKGWRKVSYADALAAARAIGQGLLDRGLSAKRPVLILSGNSIEHALLSLACLHVGVPFVPISTAYSLVSSDFGRLRGIVELVRPGLVFADDGDRYAAALRACTPEYAEIAVVHGDPGRPTVLFDALLAATATGAVSSAAEAVHADTVAKLLFTSGSTGVPKGVISSQRTLCSVTEMLLTCYPANTGEPPVLVDWLPWSHVFGSTCFGIALFGGGTFYIDDGRPLPGQIEETVRNLREVAPTLYSNVPKGYEELVVLAVPADPNTVDDPQTHACLRAKLTALADQAGGSAQRVLRLMFLTAKLSIDGGELTDKGVLNQRNILRRHSALVEQLYAGAPGDRVIHVIPGADGTPQPFVVSVR